MLAKNEIETLRKKISAASLDVQTIRTVNNEPRLDEQVKLGAVPLVFQAASLSKPVFAYLVLKLAQDHGFNLDAPLDKFYKHEKLNGYEHRELLTARKVLSHQTGLAGRDLFPEQKFDFLFKPGEGYAYSGLAYVYLQEVIEKYYGNSLEDLAQKIIFEPWGMKNSSFTDKPCSANSLQTTAEDYAIFMNAMLRDPKMREAFNPVVSLTKDTWAMEKVKNGELHIQDLQNTAWGLGWVLEKTDNGMIAFHWGDMGPSKSFAAINLTTGVGCVYFADDAQNGLSIADPLITATVKDLNHGLKFVLGKYGYQSHTVENFKEKEKFETWENMKYEIPLQVRPAWIAYLVEKGFVEKDDKSGLIKYDPTDDNASLLAKLIEHQLNKFLKENNMTREMDYTVTHEKDPQGKKLILSIKMENPEFYKKFIEKLNAEKWLPSQINTLQKTESALAVNQNSFRKK